MAEKFTLTQEGFDKIQAEYDELISVRRAEIAEKLKEARSYGDLSENAEYDAAKEEQAEIEERINKLENMLKNAEILNDDEISNDFVGVGLKVKVKNLKTKEVSTYAIVGTTEADPFAPHRQEEGRQGGIHRTRWIAQAPDHGDNQIRIVAGEPAGVKIKRGFFNEYRR